MAFARSVIRNTVTYQQPRPGGLVQLTCSEAVSRLTSWESRSKESRGSPKFRLVAVVKEGSVTYKSLSATGLPSSSTFMDAPVFSSSLTFTFIVRLQLKYFVQILIIFEHEHNGVCLKRQSADGVCQEAQI